MLPQKVRTNMILVECGGATFTTRERFQFSGSSIFYFLILDHPVILFCIVYFYKYCITFLPFFSHRLLYLQVLRTLLTQRAWSLFIAFQSKEITKLTMYAISLILTLHLDHWMVFKF